MKLAILLCIGIVTLAWCVGLVIDHVIWKRKQRQMWESIQRLMDEAKR